MEYIIGFDAGTTAFKAGLYDRNMRAVCQVSEEYCLVHTGNGFVECPVERYWAIFCRLIHAVLAQSDVNPSRIRGISICSQGETLIMLDGQGNAIYDAIVWTDARAADEAREINREFGSGTIFDITGQREAAATWPASKILWVKKNLASVFKKADKFLLLEDYLVYRLTGFYATDKSLSSSTLMLDIYGGGWWGDMMDFIGISPRQLPTIFESGRIIAGITRDAAGQTGLEQGTTVISGALDQASGMLGSGNIRMGIVSETTGTCLAVCANIGSARVRHDDAKLLPVHYGIVPGSYYTICWSSAAGSIYKWLVELLNGDGNLLYDRADSEAAAVPPGCDGLLLLPYLDGMNYPIPLGNARGVFAGISLMKTRGHFYRAVMESIAFMLRQSLDEIAKYGISVECIYSLGGGAASGVWNQIKADVTAKQIRTLNDSEATCRGAAILAAIGAGMHSTFDDAVRACVTVRETFEPLQAPQYEDFYCQFQRVNGEYLRAMGIT